MGIRTYNILFLCTGNSARSIIAESAMNAMSYGRVRAFSAGSHPSGRVNPLVLEYLREKNLPVEGARSKSWDEFAAPGAPKMDFIVTVCDSAAGETCPIWPGRPATAHWPVEDPAAHMDDPPRARKLIEDAHRILRARIQRLLDLPLDELDRAAIQAKLREFGGVP